MFTPEDIPISGLKSIRWAIRWTSMPWNGEYGRGRLPYGRANGKGTTVSRPVAPGTIRGFSLVIGAALLLVTGSLIAYGLYIGHYVRPTSDDWCALVKTRDLGVWGITKDYYDTQNGRLANAFVTGLVYSLGLLGPQLLPVILSVSLAFGLALVFRKIWFVLGWRIPFLVLLAAASAISAVLYFASTNPYQALLWAPATISHLLASVIAVWVLLLALHAAAATGRWQRPAALALVLGAAVFVGTLSEPFVAMGGLLAGTGLLLSIPGLRARRDWFPAAWCATACVGLLTGFAILYTSPGATWRRAQDKNAPSLLSGRQLRGTVHDLHHILNVVTGQWIYLAAVAVGLLVGLATEQVRRDVGEAERAPRPRWARWAVLTLPIPLVLIGAFAVALGLRQGYGPTGWAYVRAWTSFLIPMLLTLALYGVLAGRRLRERFVTENAAGGARLVPAVAIAMVAAAAFVLTASANLVSPLRTLDRVAAERAKQWDEQDAGLKAAAARGQSVVPYQQLRIGGLAEPFTLRTYSQDWAAACVAQYYHVDRLTKAPQGTLPR
jgi:hypothetical protein